MHHQSESNAILLIHGFAGGKRDYKPLKKYLQHAHRAVDFFEFTYSKRFGEVPISENADHLADYIDAHLEGREYYVVAFSQGGILWRACAMQYPDRTKRVRAVFTICSPHKGTVVAHAKIGPGVVDLLPGSALLQSLDAYDDRLTYFAIYNPIDSLVIPGTSGIFTRAQENIAVRSPLHASTFREKKTLQYIDEKIFGPHKNDS